MSEITNIIDGGAMDRLAEESGLAIAVVDENSHQVYVTNNNSICRHLNPTDEFSRDCARFCGKALEKAVEAGTTIGFECHAGLDCRAIPAGSPEKRFVVIAGRTFLKADNYRKATERAITGDWSQFPPAEFFENVLLTGSSSVLNKAAQQVEQIVARSPPDSASGPEIADEHGRYEKIVETEHQERTVENIASPVGKADDEPVEQPGLIKAIRTELEKRTAEARAWRSFFGSILKTDYARASASILEFLAHQFGFSALIWLEKKGNLFENTAAFGEMTNRKVRLGITPDDPRLTEAFQGETPLELGERSKGSAMDAPRVMHLFPVSVGGDISAAVAILDPIDTDEKKKQIARICHSIAPQLEILRLRNEVSGRDAVANAVRIFSNSLKGIDADDFWQKLTQNTAEMLGAERASLLIQDEKSGDLEIKAIIGAKGDPTRGNEIGGRVARIVFAKNEAVVVSDVSKTGLPPASPERKYRTASFLSCPINVGQRTIGVMSFTDRAGSMAFDKKSLDLFQAIAPQLAVAIDRATLKEKAGEFEQLSVTDALTGLLNRRYIEERLMEEIKRSNRHGFPMSFMMLDVDHFKSYNDAHGHPAGDIALKIVAHVIRETLRGADVAARFGGEEFSILLPQTTSPEAITIAERIRSNIEHADFPHRPVTTSIGIASCSAELCVSSDLISAADKALYEAKRQGRNRVLTFEGMDSMRSETQAK